MNDEMISEAELIEKLLNTFHLNVIDRKNLPKGEAKFSLIKNVIIKSLNNHGWFPENLKPESQFNGGLLEKLPGNKVKLYLKKETSMDNFSLIEAQEYSNLDEAIQRFLKIMFGPDIDGIPINYSS